MLSDAADNISDAIIIGTGFSGLGMAIALRREGKRSFVVLERGHDVGGTWRDNTYPGAACDIQSHLYSYSFRPNPNWSRLYATQPEILEYLRGAARDEGVLPHVSFGETVTRATWNDAEALWRIDTDKGSYRARALVSAAGHLSDPSYPDIPGIESFGGRMFHSSRWEHCCETRGRKIGVIGTGASAIQIVPELAQVAARLVVFQRTAPYVIPRRDHAYSKAEKGMFARLPQTAQRLRDELFWFNEARFPQRRKVPAFMQQITAVAQGHLDAQVTDPELKKKLTPPYEIGCKRILISNDYYPALALPNVALETDGIASVNHAGVLTRTNVQHDLDLLVVATGFEATNLPIAEVIHGRNGARLAERWAEGGEAYACTAIAGFPNLFVMLGPNTGLGAGSMIYMIETQINYIREALDHVIENAVSIEPDAAAERNYVDTIHRRSEGTVWTSGGCASWYLHGSNGKLTALWPDFMSQFRAENGSFSSDGYVSHARPG